MLRAVRAQATAQEPQSLRTQFMNCLEAHCIAVPVRSPGTVAPEAGGTGAVYYTARAPVLVVCSDPAQDVAAFKQSGGHVMIGTPGRIEDVMKRCPLMDFKRLEVSPETPD